MKKLFVILFLILSVSLFAQRRDPGYTGPGRSSDRLWTNTRVQLSVADALTQLDDTKCLLRGRIINQISDDDYTFADDTGTIEIEIEYHCWKAFGAGVSADDIVFLYGEIDKERNKVTFDVREISRAQ